MSDYPKPTSDTLMPFGKHKGVPLGELDAEYCAWFISTDWAKEKFTDLYDFFKNGAAEEAAPSAETSENDADPIW